MNNENQKFRFEDLGLCNGRISEEHHFLRKPMAVDGNKIKIEEKLKLVSYQIINAKLCLP